MWVPVAIVAIIAWTVVSIVKLNNRNQRSDSRGILTEMMARLKEAEADRELLTRRVQQLEAMVIEDTHRPLLSPPMSDDWMDDMGAADLPEVRDGTHLEQ